MSDETRQPGGAGAGSHPNPDRPGQPGDRSQPTRPTDVPLQKGVGGSFPLLPPSGLILGRGRREQRSLNLVPGLWQAYCDGSVEPNPGVGGWGVLLISPDGVEQELCGGPVLATTNQRMEVQAANCALRAMPAGCPAQLFSDSRYLVESANGHWKMNANRDLWLTLMAERYLHPAVTFTWLKGHAGHPLQERADMLAQRGRLSPAPDGLPGALVHLGTP